MADVKISQLPASTTPLGGTELVPLVQSGVTKNVSVANLTAGRAVSASSLTVSTGNVTIGTSGQGIDFSATPGTGTSELFSDYEEGTWTPNFTCTTPGNLSATYVNQLGFYTKIGRLVTVNFFMGISSLTYTTASGTVQVTGLPFTVSATTGAVNYGAMSFQGIQKTNYTQAACAGVNNSTYLVVPMAAPATNQNLDNLQIGDMPSGGYVYFRGSVSYIV